MSESPDSVCLFAQYDPTGRVAPRVVAYLSALRACGFTVHLACSGVQALEREDAAALAAIGVRVHCRANAGLDFGAWQHLMRLGCAEGAAGVLLANDSVFGPFADLAPIFAAMRARRLDAWGMVASREGRPHLQSWFLWLSAEALARPALRRVFAQDFCAMSKSEVILYGELALGLALEVEGLRVGALHEAAPMRGLRRAVPVNPMHFHWATLVGRRQVPFLKRELLRDNPAQVPLVSLWPEVVEAAYGVAPAALGAPAASPGVARRRIKRLLLWFAMAEDRPATIAVIAAALLRRARRGRVRPADRRS